MDRPIAIHQDATLCHEHEGAALYTAKQARDLDERATRQANIPGATLMLRAGRAAFALLQKIAPTARSITVFCGAGNNAGDGYVVASCAQAAGWQVQLFCMVPPKQLHGDAARAAQVWRESGGHSELWSQDNSGLSGAVIVDALLGIGADRPLQGAWADAVKAISHAQMQPGKVVLALDIPSGLQANTGRALGHDGVAVQADRTITFIARKWGLFTGQAATFVGQLSYTDCGVSARVFDDVQPLARVVNPRGLAKRRQPVAHKGDHGFALAVGGDVGMPGAVRLCAEAAARCGAGRVAVASRAEHLAAIVGPRPELMFRAAANTASWQNNYDTLFEQVSVICCGPGLGRSDWSAAAWQAILQAIAERNLPAVLDADALYWLAQNQDAAWENWVLTPHPGEAATLLHCSTAEIQADRLVATQRYGGVVVLKGAGTVIADGQRVWVNASGNNALATGGTGDVLTGVIAALLAQGYGLSAAARLGVWLHGKAAEQLQPRGGPGLLAGDLAPVCAQLLTDLMSGKPASPI